MKRILLYLLTLVPLCSFAQLQTGYYRVQNYYSGRFISIVDDNATIEADPSSAGMVKADLAALYMIDETTVLYNPATFCYVTVNGTNLTLEGQGLVVQGSNGSYLRYGSNSDGTYFLYGYYSGNGLSVRRYLSHTKDDKPKLAEEPETRFRSTDWYVYPVDDTHYFGILPDISTSDNSYWATMYAGFPFKAYDSSTTKAYTVFKVDEANGFAVIKEFEGLVSEETPVLFRCSSDQPADNKLNLFAPTNNDYISPYLIGNYYCNDVASSTGHRNVRSYNSSTMRMLGLTADGKPAFVKTNIKYVPANKCYLSVSSSAPDVLKIVTEEEYITGISEITTNSAEGKKTIYDLQGRRITSPSKGLYIVNGKKVVIK